MKRRNARHYFPAIVFFLFMIPLLAVGRPFRVDRLPDKGENFSCGTCHINPAGGGARNPFGADWEAIAIPEGDQYVPGLADRDSDGDGVTNDKEFDAKTNPGDAKSKPPEEPQAVRPSGKRYIPWGRIKLGVHIF